MNTSPGGQTVETLRTLPGDDARQVMWRFADRFDLQMLVQSARAIARGPVARLVAEGGRGTHEWTPDKAALLAEYDRAGITSLHLDPQHGGFIDGPKNLAAALVALELAWVDAGAATACLAQHLALAPIHLRGTPAQRDDYVARASGAGGRPPIRGAFCLTEPIPYAGVETGLLSGRARVAEWPADQEPILQVDKRGRFITNMAVADFVVVAVDSADDRLAGSCLIVLERFDPGVFDRGVETRKLVHQLSSTSDPVFSVRVPASRIIGGYSVRDGVIVPRHGHAEILEAVFRRTRVTVGVMTAAKLLSAVEPILRYQRTRFRGSDQVAPGTPRYDLGLQQREDALLRLIDVWATGEAATSMGLAAARLFDELEPLDARKQAVLDARGVTTAVAEFRVLRAAQRDAVAYLRESTRPEGLRDDAVLERLGADDLVRFLVANAVGNVVCPVVKLWNTGVGATMMREAVSLMGGYGITEDCPGFLGHKWMDAQLEATYEGPEVVQRRQLSLTMTDEVFLAQFEIWLTEMHHVAACRPGTGALTLAAAMELWLWTLRHLQRTTDAAGAPLYHGARQGVTFALADALGWLLASRYQVLDLIELEAEAPGHPTLGDGAQGLVSFLTDLCHVQAARCAGEVGRIAAELVFGYARHPTRDDEFTRLRTRLETCLTGARLAKDRAAMALTRVMIPEALDYPQ